ncbi:MAG TPA: TatD family hydrolase [Chlamydiales bacterium]|nr:TatD family hydrolase [Chlamydiales bacterium]
MFDSHAHLTCLEVLPHLDAMIQRAQNGRISHILNICTDLASLSQGLRLTSRHPFIQNAAATPPHDVESDGEEAFLHFEAAARANSLRAIGETGLDYHYTHSSKNCQRHFLKRYLRLAMDIDLPVIFHCREAFADLFSIADEEYQGSAILHCFTGTCQEAESVLQRGWYLSLSGIVTFKKSEALRDVAKMVPLSQLLIETDTPFLAPQSRRGQPNEPAFLSEIAQCIATVKGLSMEEVAHASTENAKQVFRFT